MNATQEALYQLMKFNILSAARQDLAACPFPAEYVYAWDSGVYPLFNDGASWHQPFSAQFEVSEAEIAALSKFLDERWLAKKPISFYELESSQGVHGSASSTSSWSRVKLIAACRYMYLASLFDAPFWAALTENGKCPSEALSLARPLVVSDIYLA